MCGIAGYIGKNIVSQTRISGSLQKMQNRGPDHQDFLHLQSGEMQVYLLHSRLSIIDLDGRSNQPFSFEGYHITFNGEIYNYIELRNMLIKHGHSFATDSDTEVLLKCYIQFGEKCVEHLNGMWAFAIWDERKRNFFISRDRFAEKPLYTYQDAEGFYFSSEIKVLKTLSNENFEINLDHIKRYLVYGYKFLYKTDDTFFKKVSEVPFASNVKVDLNQKVSCSKFWSPKPRERDMTLSEAVEGTRHHLIESVRLRLRSDVPMAFCLSGGVDSAALASIAKKEFNHDVSTFSIIDDDPRYNEQAHIEATIKDLDCKHNLIRLGFGNSLERLKKLIDYHDSPVSTISYLVHSMLSEKISENGFKVAVSGTAADEMFTGYYDHFNLHLYEMRNRPDFQKYLDDWTTHVSGLIRNPFLKQPKLYFEDQSIREHNHLNSDVFSSFLWEEFSIETNDVEYSDSLLRNRTLNELLHEATRVLLHEDDLNSMMFSIENRSPFLDVNLFDFAYSIPLKFLIMDGYGKFPLRKSLKGILNDKVRLERRKKGFNASISSLFDFKDRQTRELLLSDGPIFDIVRKEEISKLLDFDFFENSYKKFLFNFINAKFFLERFA